MMHGHTNIEEYEHLHCVLRRGLLGVNLGSKSEKVVKGLAMYA